jgi:hypothetical protein
MTQPLDLHAEARKLLQKGWVPNFAEGSVTRPRDNRVGLVDATVWHAMKELMLICPAYQKTEPQAFSAGSWPAS